MLVFGILPDADAPDAAAWASGLLSLFPDAWILAPGPAPAPRVVEGLCVGEGGWDTLLHAMALAVAHTELPGDAIVYFVAYPWAHAHGAMPRPHQLLPGGLSLAAFASPYDAPGAYDPPRADGVDFFEHTQVYRVDGHHWRDAYLPGWAGRGPVPPLAARLAILRDAYFVLREHPDPQAAFEALQADPKYDRARVLVSALPGYATCRDA